MPPDRKDDYLDDSEHHQAGAEPAKPEHIGMSVAEKQGKPEEKGKQLGESDGAHERTTGKTSDSDKKL
jgi:hypothetical protein